VLVALDHLRVEAVLEQVADSLVQRIEPLRVDPVDPVKRPRDRLHLALHNHMRVVRHQAVRMGHQPSLLEEPPQQCHEEPVVVGGAEDQAAVDAANGDVEDPVCGEHPSGNARHFRRLS